MKTQDALKNEIANLTNLLSKQQALNAELLEALEAMIKQMEYLRDGFMVHTGWTGPLPDEVSHANREITKARAVLSKEEK